MMQILISLLSTHLLIIIGEIIFIIALFNIIADKKISPSSMSSWLFAMLAFPYVAVPLFFILKKHKRIAQYQKAQFSIQTIADPNFFSLNLSENNIIKVLTANQIPPPSNNDLKLYFDATEAYNDLMQAISNAKSSINICTYVFHNDALTKQILTILTHQAQAGVIVRLMIDSLGSYPVYFKSTIFKELRQAGGQVKFFMPIFKMPFRNYINYRNHRKIYLIDQKIVFSGGMNLGFQYLGTNNQTHIVWKDILFKIEGMATVYFYNVFISDWAYVTKQNLSPLNNYDTIKTNSDISLQVIPSGPDVEDNPIYEAILTAIYDAKIRIWIVTPYFVPSNSLLEALLIAKRRNVDVRLITPRASNHFIADLARSAYMRDLNKNGIEIYFLEQQMIHAKAILFDNNVLLGSINLDNRSLFLNYEITIMVYSEIIVNQVLNWMQSLINESTTQFYPISKIRSISENLIKLLTPLL